MRPELSRPRWGTLGTAIDYRIRYYFDITQTDALAAFRGAHHFTVALSQSASLDRAELAQGFFESLKRTIEDQDPRRRRLAATDERLLCRYCYVLALFEELWRSDRPSPLDGFPKGASVEDLLAFPTDADVDDLVHMSQAFYDRHRDLLDRHAVLNPSFVGSRDVGDADADLIVAGCLLEIKATTEPKNMRPTWPLWLYQVLGYVLLDYGDEYRIGAVGVYLARQALLITWQLTELLTTLSSSGLSSLPELRTVFRTRLCADRLRETS